MPRLFASQCVSTGRMQGVVSAASFVDVGQTPEEQVLNFS